MVEDRTETPDTLALSTEVEEHFVSPLTALRGALEILHDYPDLAAAERAQFVDMALDQCGRLETSVRRLATSVYDAARRPEAQPDATSGAASERLRFDVALDLAEIDLSGLIFDSSEAVNRFYDRLDRDVIATGRKWHFIVNYEDCAIWPEAWVAFAHRTKKAQAAYAEATVRYASPDDPHSRVADPADPDFVVSRDAAVQRIAEIRAAT